MIKFPLHSPPTTPFPPLFSGFGSLIFNHSAQPLYGLCHYPKRDVYFYPRAPFISITAHAGFCCAPFLRVPKYFAENAPLVANSLRMATAEPHTLSRSLGRSPAGLALRPVLRTLFRSSRLTEHDPTGDRCHCSRFYCRGHRREEPFCTPPQNLGTFFFNQRTPL